MQIKFIPLDYDSFDFQGRNHILIIGRTLEGKKLCIIDSFEPYFFVVLNKSGERKIDKINKEIEKIEIKGASRITRTEKIEIHQKKFLGKEVKAIKVFITNYKDAHAFGDKIIDKIGKKEIQAIREYDINLITKYIIDKKVMPLCWHKADGEILNNSEEFNGIDSSFDVDLCIKADKIEKEEKEEKKFSPKILAFDIEADEFEIGKGEILMISLYGENLKKVLTWKKFKAESYVEYCKDEAEMLEKFSKCVKKESPDLLVGYFSDGFDMPYLKARAEKNKIKLDLGIDGSGIKFSGGRNISAYIKGIVHVDLFKFINNVFSQYLQSETLGLNEVASELIGEGKKEFDKKSKPKAIKDHEWKDYFAYNLHDSVLTYKLAEKLWFDMFEFSHILQEPVFEITRDSMSQLVENYILHNLDKYNEIAEKRPIHEEIEKRRQRERYEGAFVLQPKANLYENLAIFDFTSMYASVIVTYNLSLASYFTKKQTNSLEVDIGKEEPKKVYFSKKETFFSKMLREIIELRKKYKQEYKKQKDALARARSNAYKLLANSAYGYQGFFGARWYCVEAAASTAALARKFIKEVIEKVDKENFKVIYADTDSVAFLLQKKTKHETLEFLKKLNSELPGIMELELEDFYKRGLWITKRTGEFGAKKKYALITEDRKFKVRGFETVRRDWCNLARELQNKVLQKILEDGNEKKALEIVKKTIKELKERKIEREEIIIRTQLKKPLNEYKAITPHVIAARKIKEKGMPVDAGMLIEYFIAETREKKALVREKVKLPDEKGEYNIKYYLEHQILPALENIFEVFNVNLKEIADGKKQMKLGEF